MSDAPIRVLFVSTGGAARAILAEALLRHVGGARFDAVSAGTDPVPVDPLALQILTSAGIDTEGLRSRGLDEVQGRFFDWVAPSATTLGRPARSSPARTCRSTGATRARPGPRVPTPSGGSRTNGSSSSSANGSASLSS